MKIITAVFLTAIALTVTVSVLRSVKSDSSAEALGRVENAVRRLSVSCYASEGFYPPDIGYLKDHYGLQTDETKYTVIYEIFSENVMPEISVLPIDG